MSKKRLKQQVDCNNLPDNPVKRIRTRLGLEQAPFAEMLGCSDKYVSMLENGNRKVSYRLAEKIIKIAPPGTRIEWVMGRDNIETEDEEWAAERQRSQKTEIMWETLLNKAAHQAGYAFEQRHLSMDEFLNRDEGYIFTDSSGKKTGFSWFDSIVNGRRIEGIESFQAELFDYAAYRLKRMIERKSNVSSWTISLGDEEGSDDNG